MKTRKLINIILIVVAVAIAVIIGRDFISNRAGKSVKNPYELDLSQFAKVDSSEILYKEVKAIQLNAKEVDAISIFNDTIYVAADSTILLLNTDGLILKKIAIPTKATALAVDDAVLVALKNRIIKLTKTGDVLADWPDMGPRSVITSLAVDSDHLYVADAGNRVVLDYTKSGALSQMLGERNEEKGLEGFTVPSPYFDVAISEEGYLWAVDPGRHSLINFNVDGSLRTSWQHSSANTEGFSGCCNPAHMCLMEGDRFVTSEKGIVRVKIYDQHGKYLGVVAAPNQFDEYSEAPDICVDSEGRVLLLDFSRKQIRFFQLKKEE
ncbi:NHL repeat-containing protein [Mangrovibacterium diazotrophicum]|uniref:NHL repeat-containing protein n=1 Tax=Mangrovibacterium diazotrophicum TaxID=1261403 RepID=A0A419W3F4_9BACT|nr:hypothetical protein [Mangrovibacterium diazotrophicum]RKD89964.1 hypothetical protein BC643_0298 [Mangrovibacterium diazotrophicum]